jgi:uncharacterized cupredoxin-like copper-binding protein
MRFGKMVVTAGGAAALAGMVAFGGPAAWAQDATPQATEAMVPRPAHIHTGTCKEVGEVVAPLTDLTGATGGDRVGQSRRAIPAESSFTSVPMTLDAILGEDHVVNVHLSAEEIGTYIACGEIGGMLTPEGAVIIGLRELNNSGFTGIAYLAPGADGASTDVSVFVAPTLGGAEKSNAQENEEYATPGMGGMDMGTPEASTEMTGTPAADTGNKAMKGGEEVPVSLMEFAIDMPDTLTAGPVTFMVTNNGTITHSFSIEGAGLDEELKSELAPGETGKLKVDLAPGTYEVYCPVDGHRQQGMELEVTVA